METSQNYEVAEEMWADEPVIALYDRESGAKAMIAPRLGANCAAWSITHQGQNIPVLETPDSPDVLRQRGSRMGVPVLFPFPGRVREARYNYEGKEFHLPRTDKGGVHHIHGLVLNRPWKVVNSGATPGGAQLTLQIESGDLPEESRQGYPFEFALSIRYTVQGFSLTYDITVENRERSLTIPFGFGLHPYLRAPLVPTEAAPDRSGCLLKIPAATHWPTQDGLPSGPALPCTTAQNFMYWKMLGHTAFDDMYGNAIHDQGWSVAAYRNPGSGLEMRVRADESFHDWVFFTPPDRPSVAIEPYTCPPNAINFEQEGITGGTLNRLKAGQSWQARVVFEVAEY